MSDSVSAYYDDLNEFKHLLSFLGEKATELDPHPLETFDAGSSAGDHYFATEILKAKYQCKSTYDMHQLTRLQIELRKDSWVKKRRAAYYKAVRLKYIKQNISELQEAMKDFREKLRQVNKGLV
jgi:hypothetical protein